MSTNYIKNESHGDRNKTLSVKEYLNGIRPYHKWSQKSDTWKIQLPTAINCVSHRETDEKRGMHSKSD